MGDAKERTDPLEEFADGFSILFNGVFSFLSNGSIDRDKIFSAYPYIRSFNENINKYIFAKQFISGLTYDVPCGTGYGTAILASTGNRIVGVDSDRSTIESCMENIRYPNVRFAELDMMDSSTYIPAGGIMSIVCLDGLEHISPGVDLLNIFHEVLMPGGRLVISAPVASSLELSMEYNKFHKEDYDFDKFYNLVYSVFGNFDMYGIDASGNVSMPTEAFTSWIAVCAK